MTPSPSDEITFRNASVAELLPNVEAIIFDIDGVLLDVSRSIRTVNCLSIPTYLRTLPGWTAPDNLLTSDDIERFKTAGGFNDDWDLTWAAVLLYLWKAAHYNRRDAAALHVLHPTIEEYTAAIADRGGWLHNAQAYLQERATPDEWAATLADFDAPRIKRLYQELWAGDNCLRLYGFAPEAFTGPGWIRRDTPLLNPALIPDGPILAALTGRTRAEAEFGLEKVKLAGRIAWPDHAMTKDDGNHKPDPSGLATLISRLGCRTAVYVGDTVDDLRTVLNYRALSPETPGAGATVFSAQVLTGTVGPDARALFAAADVIALDVNTLLRCVWFPPAELPVDEDLFGWAGEYLDQVHDRETFITFVKELASERREAAKMERAYPMRYQLGGALGWENGDIAQFLEACLESFEDRPLRPGTPETPSWRAFAEFLYFGKIYE